MARSCVFTLLPSPRSTPGQLKYLIFTLFLVSSTFAQTYLTVIDSSRSVPLPGAKVTDGANTVISLADGRVDISALSLSGYLLISAEGFHNRTIPGRSAAGTVVYLYPLTEEKSEVLITGNNNAGSSLFEKKIDLSSAPSDGFFNLSDILKRELSLFVKEYGGAASLKQISYRGLSPENSLVLFNGVRVNDIKTGGFDLSMLSLGDLAFAGFSSLVSDEGYISPGGVLELGTTPAGEQGVTLTERVDDAGLFSFSGAGKIRSGGFSLAVTGERMWSPNRFNYEFEGRVRERENAHFNRSFASISAGHAFSNFSLDFYSNYTIFNSGVPGFVVSNNTSSSEATSKVEGTLNILRFLGKVSEGVSFEVSAGYNHQKTGLNDPKTAWYKGSEVENSTLDNFSLNTAVKILISGFDLSLGYGFEKGELRDIKTVLSNQRRESFVDRTTHRFVAKGSRSFLFESGFLKTIALNAGVNADIFDQKGIGSRSESPVAWSAGLGVVPAFFDKLELKGNYFSGKRVPTYNEYYYSSLFSGGELDPEKFNGFEAGIVVKRPVPFIDEARASYYSITTNDKIIWVPSIIGLQIPRNVSKIESRGVDLSIEASDPGTGLSIAVAYSYLDARNISPFGSADGSDGKQLIYTPNDRVNTSLRWEYEALKVIIDHRFTGVSWFTSDNNPVYYLGANNVIDLHFSWSLTFMKSANTLALSVFNLFNENYKVIQSYPMPLRTVVVSLTTKI